MEIFFGHLGVYLFHWPNHLFGNMQLKRWVAWGYYSGQLKRVKKLYWVMLCDKLSSLINYKFATPYYLEMDMLTHALTKIIPVWILWLPFSAWGIQIVRQLVPTLIWLPYRLSSTILFAFTNIFTSEKSTLWLVMFYVLR